MKLLETINLYAGYKKARNIIKDINISVEACEFVGLFGTNGAGKSTLLRALMGLLYEQKGQIRFYTDEKHENNDSFIDISRLSINRRSRMGIKYLTQDAQIFPAYTVQENLLFVLNYDRQEFDRRLESIIDIFPDFNDPNFLHKKGHILSGGEREKTAIAMVLITHPRLLMLDEPSAGLSPNLVENLLKGIKRYKEIIGNSMGVILIEQQKLLNAKNICDNLYLLKNGETVDLDGNPSSKKMKAAEISDQNLEEFMLVKA